MIFNINRVPNDVDTIFTSFHLINSIFGEVFQYYQPKV